MRAREDMSVTFQSPDPARQGGALPVEELRQSNVDFQAPLLKTTDRSMTFCSSRILPRPVCRWLTFLQHIRWDTFDIPAHASRVFLDEVAGEQT